MILFPQWRGGDKLFLRTALSTKAAEVMAVNAFFPSMFLHVDQLVPSLEFQEACWVPG